MSKSVPACLSECSESSRSSRDRDSDMTSNPSSPGVHDESTAGPAVHDLPQPWFVSGMGSNRSQAHSSMQSTASSKKSKALELLKTERMAVLQKDINTESQHVRQHAVIGESSASSSQAHELCRDRTHLALLNATKKGQKKRDDSRKVEEDWLNSNHILFSPSCSSSQSSAHNFPAHIVHDSSPSSSSQGDPVSPYTAPDLVTERKDAISVNNGGASSSQAQPTTLLSIGSADHGNGNCRPCAWNLKRGAPCRMGLDCEFCHLCDNGELKRRQKMKKDMYKKELMHRRETMRNVLINACKTERGMMVQQQQPSMYGRKMLSSDQNY